MARNRNNHSPGTPAQKKTKEDERKLLEKHPFETMSQIQNRYGNGRERNGSDGSEKGAGRLAH